MPSEPVDQPKRARPDEITFDNASDLLDFIREESVDESDRMVVHGSVINDPPTEPQEEETEEEAVADDPHEGKWGPKPSVAAQMHKFPSTVRCGPFKNRQYVLSEDEQLTAWNNLQADAHPLEAPRIQLTYEHSFAPSLSSYIILATYCEIEYQQL